jgi:uncharacterized protein
MVRVEVAFGAAPRKVHTIALTLPRGATVSDAVAASGISASDALRYSIWGKRCTASRVLADGDRVECCRPLRVDPKQARRLRSQAQPKAGPKAKRPAVAGR